MATRANISSGYRWRLAIVAAVCLMFAGWSAYDGIVKYPRLNRERDAFERYKQDHPTNWEDTWGRYADEQGLPDNPDEKKSFFSIIAQFVQVGITLPIGLVFGFGFVSTARRWIESDEAGLTSSRGERVPYESVKTLNKDRWANKGIAVVVYEDDGREKRLVIDDWKYERLTTDQVLVELEQNIAGDKIVGGTPEVVDMDRHAPVDTADTEPTPSESSVSDSES